MNVQVIVLAFTGISEIFLHFFLSLSDAAAVYLDSQLHRHELMILR